MEHSSKSRVRHPDESLVVKHNHNHDNARSAGLQLKPVRFEFTRPQANTVCVAGTFNYSHSEVKPMHPVGKGCWVKRTVLRPGTHEYCLVVDREWKPDPLAKETVSNHLVE
jgi:1,4-alpha-glucan branching enzyme